MKHNLNSYIFTLKKNNTFTERKSSNKKNYIIKHI